MPGEIFRQTSRCSRRGRHNGFPRVEVSPAGSAAELYRSVDVILPESTNVNQALVKDGWCWWFWKYAPGNWELESLGAEAREAQRRLWANQHPVSPWEWRK